MIGTTVNFLHVLARSHRRCKSSRHIVYTCKCLRCGRVLDIVSKSLTPSGTRSCGCLREELASFHASLGNLARSALARRLLEEREQRVRDLEARQRPARRWREREWGMG